ncbi:histidine kinase [Paenibacillus sp. LHD-117]|uniref:cache domain-containing sensor histidine kinase n=1 Tax=Paenibacillus sp. LHD-117 TaxID=3071412 RepID=UPI0027E1F096|nr:histidine kinase [Paenibacillus sp. LHD-117]MDQ6422191.1 histidine kinase [Paenibacillus sp. LHD-117]
MRLLTTSVRYKLIALMLISIVVPIAASIIVTHVYTKESVKERSIEENTRLISEGKTNISNYLDVVSNASLTLYSNTTMENILAKGVADNKDRSYVYTALQLVSKAANNIYQVYLFLDNGQNGFLMNANNFAYGHAEALPNITDISPYGAITIPTHPSNNYGVQQIKPNKEELVFSIYRPLFRVPTSERIGLLAIDVQVEALRELTAQLYNPQQEDLYIIDGDGTIIFASDGEAIGERPEHAWIDRIFEREAASGSMEKDKSGYDGILLYDQIQTPYLDWTIVKRIPDQYLSAQANKLTMINTVIAVLFLSVATVAVLIVSIRFTNPIKQLIRSINKIQTGQLEEPIDIVRNDEFGILATRFRTMMNTINELIFREYKLNLANKTTQLKMLQAQINPHFINNALQSIGASALDNDAPEVYNLVSSLGQMMHYSMNTKEMIVPLSQELDYVHHYLLLQQQRFDEKLKIEYALDEGAGSVPIPKMIIQPLVENYFKHGFHISQNTGMLRIATTITNGMLRITVEDNGSGISEERLGAIQTDLSGIRHESADSGDRIGLMNVMYRLHLHYGEQAALQLEQNEPRGLRITMTLPIPQQEEMTP